MLAVFSLSSDSQVLLLALVVGVCIGVACGGVMYAISLVRSPRRGL